MLWRRHTLATRVTALVALTTLAACQHYVPTTIEQTERPQRVRVHLSNPVSVELLDITAHNATLIDGEVVRWDDEELVLSVWWIEGPGNSEYRGQGETAVIPRSHIAAIEAREISVGKSLALAGMVVLVTIVGVGTLTATGGSGSGSENGQEQ